MFTRHRLPSAAFVLLILVTFTACVAATTKAASTGKGLAAGAIGAIYCVDSRTVAVGDMQITTPQVCLPGPQSTPSADAAPQPRRKPVVQP